MYSPKSAADVLTERLGRPVSRPTVQAYIQSGDLAATNITPGGKQARWIVETEAIEQFAQRIAANGGELPILHRPTGGGPKRPGVQRGVGRGNGRKRRTLDTEP
jgi:hypothetical protein